MRSRIVFHYAAFNALRKSAEVRADLRRRAEAIAEAAGEGFEVNERFGKSRARASVRAETFEARKAEAQDKVLTAAIDAGRP